MREEGQCQKNVREESWCQKSAREEVGAQNFMVSKLCWVPGGSRQQDIAGMVTSIPRLPFHAGLQHTLKLTFLCRNSV